MSNKFGGSGVARIDVRREFDGTAEQLVPVGQRILRREEDSPRRSAPELGQDNEDILTSIGYTKEQIGDLAQRQVI